MRNENIVRARFARMTTDELREVVRFRRDDYVPRALELAEQELARRPARLTFGESEEERPRTPSRESERSKPTRWWPAWIAAVAAFAVLILSLVFGATWFSILLRVVWAACVVPIAVLVGSGRQ
jgi:hypothetical protein